MVRYMDYAATTFPKPECVLNKIDKVNRTLAVNTGRGAYRMAREAVQIIDETREKIADLKLSGGSNGKDEIESQIRELTIENLEQILEGEKK